MSKRELLEFGLGCAQLGNLFCERSDDDAAAVLEAAWDAGVRYFDTAPHYGLGLSERRLGAFLATKPRDEFVLSTKVGRLLLPADGRAGERDSEGFHVPAHARRVWDFSEDGVRRSLEESLDRLGLDRVDILFVHDPERSGLEGATEDAMAALGKLRAEGIATHVGAGSLVPSTLLTAVRAGADLLMAANCYTLLDQGVAPDVLGACDETGARIIAAAVFNSGLLASSPKRGAMFDYAEVSEDVLVRARRIEQVCLSYGVALATAAVHYPLLDGAVASVVVGADSPPQVRENFARMAEDVPAVLWDDLADQQLVPRCAWR